MEMINTQGYVAVVLYLLGAAMYVVLFEDEDTGGPSLRSTIAGLLWPYAACIIMYSFIRGDIKDDGE
tara:strand:+ start:540 stop:740 length:201 start_codon:yes stop_codon:yes gene_type:complete